MKTIAVFLADGFEMIEALTPVDYLRRAKLNVITVAVPSPTMKDNLVVCASHGIKMQADMTLDEYLSEYGEKLPDAIVCPGGSVGAVNLSKCEKLLSHIEKCNANGKYVCAICASPAVVFGKTNVLIDKEWTCYPGMSLEVDQGILDKSTFMAESRVVLDGNLLTGMAEGASEEFALVLVGVLAGLDESERIAHGCCVRK